MHTPNPGSDPRPEVPDDDEDRHPVVPPDQQEEIVPIEEPPKPGRTDAPMRLARPSLRGVLRVHHALLAAVAVALLFENGT
jgi:hypothetical protein